MFRVFSLIINLLGEKRRMPLNHTSQFAELTDDQFKLIGMVVVEWANIEFLQKNILSRLLLNPEFVSRIYTDFFSLNRMQEAIKEAINLHRYRYANKIVNDEILTKIERLCGQIQKARTKRNKFAHFCWMRNSDEAIFGTNFSFGLPHSKKAKKSLEKSSIVITNEELSKLYNESYNLVNSLTEILKALPTINEEELVRKMEP